jgi:hypothetical protein
VHDIRIVVSLLHKVGPPVQIGDELIEKVTDRQTMDERCSDSRAARAPPNSEMRHYGPAILNRH